MLSVKVQMEDNDRDGVIVTPTGRDNVVLGDGGVHRHASTSCLTQQADRRTVTVTMTRR